MDNLADPQYGKKSFLLILCLLIALIWKLAPHPLVIIVIALLPIALMTALSLPFMMVFFFVIFSFFRIHEVVPQLYPLKLPLLLSMASIIALVWHIGISQKIKLWWRPELTMMLLFYLLVTIGVVMASNKGVAFAYYKGIYWKIALMSFAIAWMVSKPKDFAFASKAIVFAGLMVGLKALFNKAAGIGLVEGSRVTIGRDIGSVLGDPNDLALVLMFPAAFAVSLILMQGIDKTTRVLSMIALPVLFMAVLATQSRGGLLGIMAVLAIFAYRRIHSKTLFFVIGIVAAVALYAVAGISDRASGGAAEAGVDASAMGRIYAWQAAFGMAVSNPLTGVGIDNFYSNYFYYSPHWDGLNHAVHSTWFGVLAETGFLGLIVFITMITMLIRTALRTLKRIQSDRENISPYICATSEAVLAGLIGTLVSGTFLTFGFTWPIYILAALILATAQWTDNHFKKKHAS